MCLCRRKNCLFSLKFLSVSFEMKTSHFRGESNVNVWRKKSHLFLIISNNWNRLESRNEISISQKLWLANQFAFVHSRHVLIHCIAIHLRILLEIDCTSHLRNLLRLPSGTHSSQHSSWAPLRQFFASKRRKLHETNPR